MAKSPREIVAYIDEHFAEYQRDGLARGVAAARGWVLANIRALLATGRFPTTDGERFDLSLVP